MRRVMKTDRELRKQIQAMDHRGYPAYKSLAGSWRFDSYILNIDHVQGDPFAAPSKLSISVDGKRSGFPAALYQTAERRRAFEDGLVRAFAREAEKVSFKAHGSGKSGLIGCSRPGQEILTRTACKVSPEDGKILLRLEVGFPANGRSINARELLRILFDFLPAIARRALFMHREDERRLQAAAELADDQAYIRGQLEKMGLVAFVADGSVLPRESGVSQRPMKNAVPFRSPESLKVTLDLPHRGKTTGMGIRRGVTLIAGGGYHGKSTLLEAIERGVYDHSAGDGREYVITDPTAVKLRSEDGRSICRTDISMFIDNLPSGADCRKFISLNASGSTSQAANTIEAIEAGSKTFLIDEDTSATNFMVRDALMASVVSRDKEPVTPFLERVRALYEEAGISTVMVVGSSGAFFRVADTVIQMDTYQPVDITERARRAAALFLREENTSDRNISGSVQIQGMDKSRGKTANLEPGAPSAFVLPDFARRPLPDRRLDASRERVKSKVMGTDGFSVNRENVDLRAMEQLVDVEQVQALAQCLIRLEGGIFDGKRTMQESVHFLWKQLEEKGLDFLSGSAHSVPSMALPREQEIFQCVNRYRGLKMAGDVRASGLKKV